MRLICTQREIEHGSNSKYKDRRKNPVSGCASHGRYIGGHIAAPVRNGVQSGAGGECRAGHLLVVCRCRCDRAALRAALQQFEFVGSRLLGIVYNCSEKNSGTSGKTAGKAYCGKY